MSDPHPAFRISGPALISFSGGRTSAYMLHEIIRAYDGVLPDDVKVAFANTGKEREETLRFVHECGSRWGVKVHWVEWRRPPPFFEEVGYNSAARNGEPFAALIAKKKTLPNETRRFCTELLKVEAIDRFLRSLGWKTWTNIIGFRHDEGRRLLKMYARNDAVLAARQDRDLARKARGKLGLRFLSVAPLSKAKVTKRDVMAFWSRQSFDLGLLPVEGNCDLCFMKGKKAIKALMMSAPERAEWWKRREAAVDGSFVTEWSYRDLLEEVRAQGSLFDGFLPDIEFDSECGLLCPAEVA